MHALPPLLFGGIRFTCAGILLGLTTLALGNRFALDATEWRHMFVVAIGNVFIANGGTTGEFVGLVLLDAIGWWLYSIARRKAA